jgi:hypothetical protein
VREFSDAAGAFSGAGREAFGAGREVSGAARAFCGAAREVFDAARAFFGAARGVFGAAQEVSDAARAFSGAAREVSGAARAFSGAAREVSGAARVFSGAAQEVSGAGWPNLCGATKSFNPVIRVKSVVRGADAFVVAAEGRTNPPSSGRENFSSKETAMAVPEKDSLLATFAPNFSTIVSAAPATYNVPTTLAASLASASDNFVAAYDAASAEGTRSKSLTTAKSSAKLALLPILRSIYSAIQASTTVSDTQKVDLGINIRRMPVPIPAPSTEPVVSIVSVNGRTVRLRLRDASNPQRVGRPVGVASATIFSYVGTTPPASMGEWKFEANVSKTLIDVIFPDSVAPGALVWFTVFWSNRKDQAGPACDPLSAYLQFGSVSMAA